MTLDLDPTQSIPGGEAMSGGECLPPRPRTECPLNKETVF